MVYNGENFVREAVESILGQTFEDFELIISDNASTDATQEICREYAGRDERVSYHRNSENMTTIKLRGQELPATSIVATAPGGAKVKLVVYTGQVALLFVGAADDFDQKGMDAFLASIK